MRLTRSCGKLVCALALGTLLAAQTRAVPAEPSAQTLKLPAPPSVFAAKGLVVLSHETERRSNLNVWTVQAPTGQKTIFYSTPDNKVIFTGALWNAQSGEAISDSYYAAIEEAPQAALPPASVPSPAAAHEPTNGRPPSIPASIQKISKLKGVKEGDAPIYRTLYVFFDPRCPYCKRLYEMTRNAKDLKGHSVEWIPTTILGDRPRASSFVAEILQSKAPSEQLKVAFSGLSSTRVSPTADTLSALQENERVFYTAFKSNPTAGSPGVPVAFFVDRAGQPQMVPNPIETLPKILAEMY
jgi:thiol:disulfide interchange protein DsbG